MQNAIVKKGVAIGIFLCLLLVIPVKGINDDTKKQENGNTYYQTHITSHLATSEEIRRMEQQCGIFDPNKNYNVKYGCHGTGLAPPTESDYSSMIGSLHIVDTISSNQPPNSSCDLSNDPCFPMVGNQGGQGSCAAWAATYYATGFVIGKKLNWTEAHTGDATQLLSPAWTYNKCNCGGDYGSWMYDNMRVIQTVGCSTLSTMPYSDSDPVSWGDENAWRDAPPYRVNNVSSINAPFNSSTINEIKILLSGGQPVSFALDASSYNNFGSDDVLGSNAMRYGINHGNTVVGYNDSKTDAETGETGAFKVVNSWGSTWGPDNDGFYWMTYQAFLGSWNYNSLNFVDALYVDSTPNLLAVWDLNPTCDRSASVELGIGSSDNPRATRQPWWDGSSQVMHTFPSFMCLDVTEFFSIWKTSVDAFYLKIGAAAHHGTITSFKVEYYQYGYNPGDPTLISNESLDVPKNTPCQVDVHFLYPNSPPVFGGPSPANGSASQPTYLSWSISISDPDGDVFSWTIQCSNGQTSSGTNASDGTYTLVVSGLAYSTLYTVWVNATDPTGSGLYSRSSYTFTTAAIQFHKMFLAGFITNRSDRGSNITFNTVFLFVHDYSGGLQILKSGGRLMVSSANQSEFFGKRFIIGVFDAAILSKADS